MPINSRRKGADGERALVKKLREYGYEARRGQQYAGSNGDPDVVTNMEDIHIEVKYCAQGHGMIYEWLEQAKRDSREDEIPAVFHKKVSKEYRGNHWVVSMDIEDFFKIWNEHE